MQTNQTVVIGPNTLPTLSVPKRWNENSATRTTRHHGDDEFMQLGRQQLHALDRRQHRHGRCDHRIAEEERGAEDAQDADGVGQRRRDRNGAVHHRHQRQDAAFAAVIGAGDDDHVLDGDHQDHRPEHQRQDAEHIVVIGSQAVMFAERFLQGVQRAGADVAEHHADGAEHQRVLGGFRSRFARVRTYQPLNAVFSACRIISSALSVDWASLSMREISAGL